MRHIGDDGVIMFPNRYQGFDHAALDRALTETGADIGASETHGTVCGVLCIPSHEESTWIAEMVDICDPGTDADSFASLLLAIHETTREQFGSSGFEFTPLLPDDDEELSVRSVALGEWCTGFLFGLGIGGMQSYVSLPEDSREVVADFSRLAEIGPSEDGQEEEAAFVELVEYIRVGVLLISEELFAAAQEPSSSSIH